MRNINCRDIRRDIEEAAPGKWLSAEVNDHVAGCVACEKLLRQQTKLRELVSSLGTVEAPADFDFRLRARLAGESRAPTHSFAPGHFSFGFGSAAVVTALLLVGSALMFLSFKTRSNTVLTSDVTKLGANQKLSNPVAQEETVATNSPVGLGGPPTAKSDLIDEGVKSAEQPVRKRSNGMRQTELASVRGINSQRTRDLSSTPAPVLKRDQVAEIYPTSAFPIDAAYQSLKVSLDDGRGSSRTISLPTVSFGSQRSLSQSGSPLMASARGAW